MLKTILWSLSGLALKKKLWMLETFQKLYITNYITTLRMSFYEEGLTIRPTQT